MSGLSKDVLKVAKTIKLYIGGDFPRTESGRTFAVYYPGTKQLYANICLASRKDLRAAVTAARGAQSAWEGRSAYNRGQILYRLAEMLEGKRVELAACLRDTLGRSETDASIEVSAAIDACVYYAGFADKYQQLSGSINPVSGPHHNFTSPEPMGVVGVIANPQFHLGEFVADLAAVIVSGNTVVALIGEIAGALIAPLGEAIATSDCPKGVVNLLSGSLAELLPHFASHMEVQALAVGDPSPDRLCEARLGGVANLKRIAGPASRRGGSLERILDFVEFKTVWHPIGS